MTLFIQDTFTEAKALGLTQGFVGTYAELQALVHEATYHDPDEDGSLAFARWAEGGWHGGRLTDEEAEDRARNPFDWQANKPIFTDENDPDGEAENAWHERLWEAQVEAKASAWYAFPGDRH